MGTGTKIALGLGLGFAVAEIARLVRARFDPPLERTDPQYWAMIALGPAGVLLGSWVNERDLVA